MVNVIFLKMYSSLVNTFSCTKNIVLLAAFILNLFTGFMENAIRPQIGHELCQEAVKSVAKIQYLNLYILKFKIFFF